jgi:hypothetical protein
MNATVVPIAVSWRSIFFGSAGGAATGGVAADAAGLVVGDAFARGGAALGALLAVAGVARCGSLDGVPP